MLRLHKIFFSHLLILLGALFLLLSIVSYYTLKNIEIEHYVNNLKTNILLLETQISKTDDLDFYIKKSSSLLDERITIIDRKGEVLAESDFVKEDMDNHANRPEIQEARERGWGSSIRFSDTLKKSLLYVAKKSVLDGDEVYIRAAVDIETIKRNFYSLWLKILAIFGLFILFALLASYLLSKRIRGEIDKILGYLEALERKDYSGGLSVGFAAEFSEIAQHLSRLSKKLQRREEKKEKYTQKLKKINRQRNELISAISHEFKNPVAIIDGYTATLLEDDDMDPKIRKKFLQKIANASKKISTMIDRLSTAIKFENGDLQPKKSRFDLCELIHESVKFILDRYKGRKIAVNCEPHEVYADKTMIYTVLTNLLDNALKYSESEVEIRLQQGRVSIIDRGIGIKEEELEKITRKFYRARRNSWDNSMGLGLYIVNYILRLHNASLEIESKYSKGSVFSFKL